MGSCSGEAIWVEGAQDEGLMFEDPVMSAGWSLTCEALHGSLTERLCVCCHDAGVHRIPDIRRPQRTDTLAKSTGRQTCW